MHDRTMHLGSQPAFTGYADYGISALPPGTAERTAQGACFVCGLEHNDRILLFLFAAESSIMNKTK